VHSSHKSCSDLMTNDTTEVKCYLATVGEGCLVAALPNLASIAQVVSNEGFQLSTPPCRCLCTHKQSLLQRHVQLTGH